MKHSPQLVLLRTADEDPSQLVDAAPEQLLLRWLNHQLSRPSAAPPVWHGRQPVANFSLHLSDGVAALGLLRSLAPDVTLDFRSAGVPLTFHRVKKIHNLLGPGDIRWSRWAWFSNISSLLAFPNSVMVGGHSWHPSSEPARVTPTGGQCPGMVTWGAESSTASWSWISGRSLAGS